MYVCPREGGTCPGSRRNDRAATPPGPVSPVIPSPCSFPAGPSRPQRQAHGGQEGQQGPMLAPGRPPPAELPAPVTTATCHSTGTAPSPSHERPPTMPPGLSQQLPARPIAPHPPPQPYGGSYREGLKEFLSCLNLEPHPLAQHKYPSALEFLPGCSCLRTFALAVSRPRRALPQRSPQPGLRRGPGWKGLPDCRSEQHTITLPVQLLYSHPICTCLA